MVDSGWSWLILVVRKVLCGVRKVLVMCHLVSGMSQEGVRWCQKNSYGATKVSGRYEMVSGMCHVFSGMYQMV